MQDVREIDPIGAGTQVQIDDRGIRVEVAHLSARFRSARSRPDVEAAPAQRGAHES